MEVQVEDQTNQPTSLSPRTSQDCQLKEIQHLAKDLTNSKVNKIVFI